MRAPVAMATLEAGTAMRWRCRGRIGVNERPMKFTRNSTTIKGSTPGRRSTSPKASRGGASAPTARGAST